MVARSEAARRIGTSKSKIDFIARLLLLEHEDRPIPGRKWNHQRFYPDSAIEKLERFINLCQENGFEKVFNRLNGGNP